MTEPAKVILPAVLDLQYAEPLRAELLGLRGRPVVIDASRVERLGGLCLQVLISAKTSWAADGTMLDIAPVSDAFAQHWTMFGAAEAAAGQGDMA